MKIINTHNCIFDWISVSIESKKQIVSIELTDNCSLFMILYKTKEILKNLSDNSHQPHPNDHYFMSQ